jgi:hypothetical protein
METKLHSLHETYILFTSSLSDTNNTPWLHTSIFKHVAGLVLCYFYRFSSLKPIFLLCIVHNMLTQTAGSVNDCVSLHEHWQSYPVICCNIRRDQNTQVPSDLNSNSVNHRSTPYTVAASSSNYTNGRHIRLYCRRRTKCALNSICLSETSYYTP